MPLRPLTESDLPLILAWCNVPESGKSVRGQNTCTLAQRQAWIEREPEDSTTLTFVYIDENDRPRGAVQFTDYQHEQRSAFWCFHTEPDLAPDTREQMLFEALGKAFGDLKLQKLNGDVAASNSRLINLYRKLGFKQEGLLRISYFDGEKLVDVVRLGILREECLERAPILRARVEKLRALRTYFENRSPRYTLAILSDRTSWLNDYLDDLVDEWSAAGHNVWWVHELADLRPADFCFYLSVGRLVPQSVRSMFRNNLVVHGSALPEGRGWVPMTWQIIEERSRFCVTLFEAVDAVDAGPIYLQTWFNLTGTELNPEWKMLQAEATTLLCSRWVRSYPEVLEAVRPQTGIPSYYARRRPADSRLDPNLSIAAQFDLLRVVDNERYPAFFYLRGRRYTLTVTADDPIPAGNGTGACP